MHELAIAQALVEVAGRHAAGRRVAVVRARVGRLRQVEPEGLAFYFPIAARGTLCEHAELEWERTPSLLRCGACEREWDPAPPPAPDRAGLMVSFRCPSCGGSDHAVVSGDELQVDSIDVEEAGRAPAPVAARAGSG